MNSNNIPRVRKVLLHDLAELQKNALLDGFNFIVDNGYRFFIYQHEVLDYCIDKIRYVETYKRVALPCTSEHQSGLQ